MIMYTSEGYYDPSNTTNPIKYRLNQDIRVPVTYGGYSERKYGLVSNTVVKTDGSTSKFFDMEFLSGGDFSFGAIYCSNIRVILSDRYNYYEMYVDYQPSTDRRNLASSGDDNLMSSEYFIFYILSQAGGLYAFLVLVLGFVVHHITKQSFYHSAINQVYKINSIKKMETENFEVKQGNSRRVAPMDLKPINHNNSMYKEQDRLMNEQEAPNGVYNEYNDYNYQYQNNYDDGNMNGNYNEGNMNGNFNENMEQPGVQNNNYYNYEGEIYEGGQLNYNNSAKNRGVNNMGNIQRRRNDYIPSSSYYDNNDLYYSIL